mgnify:CR=1 FL=1
MNIKSLLISFVVVFILVSATDFLIHGVWLSSLYGATNELWRPEEEMTSGAYMGWLHAGHALAALAFTTLWAAGFAGKAKLTCGIKYGLFMALFSQSYTLITYAVQPMPLELIWKWMISGILQGMLLGAVVSLVYKPKPAA